MVVISRRQQHGISRLVLDAHGRFCNACPAAIPLAKLSTHVRPFARLLTLRAVFFPQQRQGHARPCQFAVDVRIVGLSILTGCFVPVRKEKLFQIGIGDIVGEGPGLCLVPLLPAVHLAPYVWNSVPLIQWFAGCTEDCLTARSPDNCVHRDKTTP